MNKLSQRYAALDVLRGMTVAGMILVNNPGNWSKIYPPLKHAAWHGCTPTDLVFPFFLFIVGVSLFFSFTKYNEKLNYPSFRKLTKRTVLIFATGLLLTAFPFYSTNFGSLRIMGVLQRIALCYFVGGIVALWLKSPKKIGVAMAGLMALHLLILLLFSPGDPFSAEGSISGLIDVYIFGANHVYKGFGLPFDPEGLLGVLSGSATVLYGYITGGIIRNSLSKTDTVAKLYTLGLISLAVGIVMSILVPINKPLWTPSYVLYAGGWSIIMLALFIYFIDIKGKEKIFYPFKAMGVNPLFAFVMAGIFAKTLGRIIRWESNGITYSASSWIYNNCCVALLGNNELGSLMYALMYVAVFLLMAIMLYRKNIIIKL